MKKLIQSFLCSLVCGAGFLLAQGTPNRFDFQRDLFIAQFDSIPDSDDVYAQAAVASVLAHPDFKGINYFCVAGAYGTQTYRSEWDYIDSRSLFALGFGREARPADTAAERAQARWVDAHGEIVRGLSNNRVRRSADRVAKMDFASDVIVERAKPILEAGGKVWVMEAGQSDFSADWIEKLITEGVTNTATNVIVVQHSDWNQNYTSGKNFLHTDGKDDWNFVTNGAHNRYEKIADGNQSNDTPNYKDSSLTFLREAKDASQPNATTRQIWTLAEQIVRNSNYDRPPNNAGGVDFSDTVEAMWIFDLANEAAGVMTVRGFWDTFVVTAPFDAPAPARFAYIYGDVAIDGTIPSGSAAPYDQMLLTDTGKTGLSTFKANVEKQGFSIDQYYDRTITLNANFLNQFDAIIFGLHQEIWSRTELAALDTWINNGGKILIYSDSASGGRYNVVGSDNPVGQSVTNNIIGGYGMEVTVDQGNGTKARRSGDSTHPIVAGDLILEGEGVSPVAVDRNAGVEVLIPYTSNVVSGHAEIPRLQNLTINNPIWASLALKEVGSGHVIVMFDRQPMWNDGVGSNITKRDNATILDNIVSFMGEGATETGPVGLVAHWSMDDGSGAIVKDVSGNGYNATLVGGSWNSDGAMGSALAFQAESAGVQLPVSAFRTLDREVTLSMWVNGDNVQPLADTTFSAEDGVGRVLNVHLPWSNSTVFWDAGNAGTAYDRASVVVDSSLYKNSWNHWAFTKNADSGVMNIYANGILLQTVTGKTKNMRGVSQAMFGQGYTGSIDEVMLFDTELSAAEIGELYRSPDDLGVTFRATDFDLESHPADDGRIRKLTDKVGYIRDNTWIRFADFDFGSGAHRIAVSASSGASGGTIEVRVGSATGTQIALVAVSKTEGWDDFETFTSDLNGNVVGVQDLYFVLRGNSTYNMDLESFRIDVSQGDSGVRCDACGEWFGF